MSIKNYRFVSPGVFVNEIDNSQIPASPAGIGPVIIGRAEKGPALRPTSVSSFEEFVNVFGAPAPGGSGGDVWRQGNDTTATTYGAYAAQAYLRNSSPLTYVRLLGSQADGYTVDSGEAGWDQTNAWGILVGEANPSTWEQRGFDFVLAGVVYAPSTVHLALSGGIAVSASAGPTKSNADVAGASWIVADTGVAKEFKLVMTGSGPASAGSTTVFNFDRTSSKYIRKVLNTNPQLTNVGITDASTRLNYWLGETFDRHLAANITSSVTWGAIVRINNTAGAANGSAGNHEAALQSAQTPQIIACRTSNNPTSRALFKIVALNEPGDWSNRNIKVSIQDIKRSPDNDNDYGTFSVVVRHLSDSDNVVRVLEQFNNCDLNPDSLNYLGRKIGTKYTSWSAAERRYVEYGDWSNVSQYIRADINSDVAAGLTSADLLPFGFQGIVKYKDTTLFDASNASTTWLTGAVRPDSLGITVHPGTSGKVLRTLGTGGAVGSVTFAGSPNPDETITIEDTAGLTKAYLTKNIQTLSADPPQFSITGSVLLQAASLQACIDSANGHNGTIITNLGAVPAGILSLTQSVGGTAGNNTITEDLAGTTVAGFAGGTGSLGNEVLCNIYYPVPELRVSASAGNLPNNTDAYFGYQTTTDAGGSVFDRSNIDLLRPRGAIVGEMFTGDADTERSITFTLDDISGSQGSWISGSFAKATAPVQSLTRVNGLVAGVLDAGFDRFTVPMYGGFDGTNVTEMDAFANRNISGNDKTNYVFNSIRQAIDSLADPEVIEMNMASIPGMTNEGLTTNLVRLCEDRADALAVIDLPDAFQPREESTAVNRLNTQSTISTIVNGLRSRNLNSSYGCAYYPWLRARDTINGAFIWVPPSVAAIGTFSSSQRKTQVWFAPAGFNRGGLTEGSAGIPVVDVAHQLRRKDRDDLYASNVNPIAKFPNEGIVIFGQKTLQVTPTALDRINVRRLMIFVKKRISRIAAALLFDPNVQQTWLRFKGQVDPFLANVKTNFGLSDYKVVLDETTTTPDLIDQNIMYAKIFLKPTRAIEYIAIDFNITRTGASFDD